MNVIPLSSAREDFLVIYRGCLFVISVHGTLKKVGQIKEGRNILHNSHAFGPDGKIYFGEYFGNNEQRPVRVYEYSPSDELLRVAWVFSGGSIRHVHSIYWDGFDQKFWVFTGDSDQESKVLVFDRLFKNFSLIGEGSQHFRAVSAFFTGITFTGSWTRRMSHLEQLSTIVKVANCFSPTSFRHLVRLVVFSSRAGWWLAQPMSRG